MEEIKNSWDHLKILTKDEIIAFLKKGWFLRAPSKYNVVFFKWDITEKKLQKEMDEHLSNSKSSEYAEEIDRLGKEYNASKNNSVKQSIINKRLLLFKKIQSETDEWNRINKKQDANYNFLKNIDKDNNFET